MEYKFDTSIEINAPLEEVYEKMTDLASPAEWMPGLVAIERLTEPPFALGSRWRETRKMFGKEATEEFEVIAVDPGKSFTLRVDGTKGSTGKGEFLFDHFFEPISDGSATRFAMNGTMKIPGLMATLTGWLMAPMMKKSIEKDIQAFKNYVEGKANIT